MKQSVRAYIGLGSNLGDRERVLREAFHTLDETSGIRVLRASSLYETEPVDFEDQPWFLNAIVEVETDLLPHSLLEQLQKIEAQFGRERKVAKGPRTLDLDLLLYADCVIEDECLALPHPRWRQRRFILQPLSELRPDFRDPVTRESLDEIMASCKDPKKIMKRPSSSPWFFLQTSQRLVPS
jgi:2-amino-4-hydroxy-6-hydroxymethyldihydropteridine diphosphokinase